MTQERFLKLLDNPDLLATISYEELKTLALAYPYAHNLRYLLAIKAGQDDHPDFSRNLSVAAAYSLDRSCLFALMVPIKLMPEEEKELVLELKPIEAVQRELDARVPMEQKAAEFVAPLQKSARPEQEIKSVEKEAPALDLTQSASLERMAVDPPPSPKAIGMRPTLHPVQVSVEESEAPLRPSFSVWISQFNPPVLNPEQAEELPNVKERRLVEKKKVSIPAEKEETDMNGLTPQDLAERSVQENKAIVSETLAKLYVNQGYLDKAEDMYERLSLAFPDKSAYFAAQIEKLKK